MLYLGLDVHCNWFTLVGFDKITGECLRVPKVLNDERSIDAVFKRLPSPRYGAMESGTNAFSMYRKLKKYFDNLIIVSPNNVWNRISNKAPKTDGLDAKGLAEELSLGRLTPIYIPDDNIRDYRSLCRGRIERARDLTRQVNEIYALLRSWGVNIENKLLTKTGRNWLDTVMLSQHSGLILKHQLEILDKLQEQHDEEEKIINDIAKNDDTCKRLMTIPGVGAVTAMVLLTEIGDIKRFSSADKLISYAGLDPRVIQSGERCRYGHITKHGNSHIRHVAVLFAQHVCQTHKKTSLKEKFYRLIHSHDRNEIKIILARDFLSVVHSMWRNGCDWEYPRNLPPTASDSVAK